VLIIGAQRSEPLSGTKSGDNPKRLLAVVTPMIIDSAGNQLHAEGKLLSKWSPGIRTLLPNCV
jgi:hypothetical protein